MAELARLHIYVTVGRVILSKVDIIKTLIMNLTVEQSKNLQVDALTAIIAS